MPTVSTLVPEIFAHRLEKAVEAVLDCEDRIQVFSHHDADGLSAAAVISSALERASKSFQVRILKGLSKSFIDSLARDKTYIFMDMGSSYTSELEEFHKVIILDHHKPTRDSDVLFHINSHILGVDGTSEASASTLAFLFALGMEYGNWDLASLAMVGMIGDKQHIGGFRGVNHNIVKAAVEKGVVDTRWGLVVHEDTLLASISTSFDPFFCGLSGDVDATRKFLEKNNFEPDAAISSLEEGEMRRLASILALGMIKRGLDPVVIESISDTVYFQPDSGVGLRTLVEYADAAGKNKIGGTGVAMIRGSTWARDMVGEYFSSYRKSILELLTLLYRDGAENMGSIQCIDSDDVRFNGALAGIGMQFILPQNMPVFSISKLDGKARVSCRGTRKLVAEGLDLSSVCRISAEKVGGEGGGHPVASGATLPYDKKKEFLDNANKMVSTQLSKKD